MKFTNLRSAALASGLALSLLAVPAALARPVPLSLANGLDKIVEDSLLQSGAILPPAGTTDLAAYRAAVAREAAAVKLIAISEPSTGKYLVDIMPDGQASSFSSFQATVQKLFPALRVTAVNATYAGHGVVEGYVTLADALSLAKTDGVRSVVLQLKPIHSVGAVTSQGINQHRVNRINTIYSNATVNPSGLNYSGMGMQIGVMSDSYDSQPTNMGEGSYTTAPQDVASGDLPGTGNTVNGQPVVVLDDFTPTTGAPPTGATNEGRGMCQIVADMAPLARIGFATADRGEVGFANNIRALAGLPGFTYPAATQQGFKGDVVCDDVSYLDEPFFQDGIVAQGVIDVVNAGVTYCSSAANNWGTDGYDSVFRPVANGTGLTAAAGNSALAGTNINLAGVDASLYRGGFHNFNPNGLDVAQLFNTSNNPQGAVFQWNDPYDSTTPTPGALVFGPATGNSTGGSSMDFSVSFTAGQAYLIVEKATPQNATENFDAIIDIIDPSGATVLTQDTGADETVVFSASLTGSHTIRVRPYATAAPVGNVSVPTMGHYTVQVNLTNAAAAGITQDFNLLFFDTSGAFLQAVASNNFASNRPYEIFVPNFSATQVQLVISRANVTASRNAANRLRYVFFGNGLSGIGPAEYNDYLTPVTFGHSAVAGANSVGAYSMFRPNLPEDYTSPGPVTIYFDTANNRLATPQVRLKPDMSAASGANNTFFPLGPAQDAPWDADSNFANFYGTSAASPHLAAIAALVIQAHGGPGSLSPRQVKTLMQLSCFPHDLDPYASGATVTTNGGTVAVSIVSDNSRNVATGSGDPNTFSISYTGPGFLKSFSFNPEGTGATGGNPTGGNYNGPGAVYTEFFTSTFYNFTPGMVFNSNASQFTFGPKSVGLTAADVTRTATNAAPAPSTNAYFWTLNFAFPNNNFTTGKVFRFNNARALQQDATSPAGQTLESAHPLYVQTGAYSADILGDGVLIPEYADTRTVLPGMTFSGVVSSGGTDYPFTGRVTNKIGKGYSPLDGYGFVDAQAATTGAVPALGVVSRRIHGDVGAFDIPLPLVGTRAVECRRPSVGGGYQLVFTFDRVLSTPGSATVSQGTAQAATPVLGPNANQITVNLTGVADAQHLTVALSNVIDGDGAPVATLSAPMDVLLGDTTGDGVVNNGDAAQTRSQSGQTVTTANFRTDVTCDGVLNAGDAGLVRSKSGNALP